MSDSGPIGEADVATGSPKRAAVLAAAAAVFLEAGVENASMDEIARRAKVSKATVYSHFESKHELLRAIVHDRCRAMMPPMTGPEFAALSPREALAEVGGRLLALMFSPIALPLYRVVLAEAARFPELGRAFYDNGPGRTVRELAEYLAAQHQAGRLHILEPALTAEQFLGAVLGHTHLRQLLAVSVSPPDAAERAARVRAAVDLVLAAAAPKAN